MEKKLMKYIIVSDRWRYMLTLKLSNISSLAVQHPGRTLNNYLEKQVGTVRSVYSKKRVGTCVTDKTYLKHGTFQGNCHSSMQTFPARNPHICGRINKPKFWYRPWCLFYISSLSPPFSRVNIIPFKVFLKINFFFFLTPKNI